MVRHNFQRTHAPRCHSNWQQGDIAFLRHYDTFSAKDYSDLIASDYLTKEATVHPVIVLVVLNEKAIITTISAFSTEVNQFLAPWEQKWHKSKNRDQFWAFEGTKRPSNQHPALRLADPSMKMPKPQASWVYAPHFFSVPFSVLGWFNKSPALLRVHPDSLCQLTLHLKHNFPQQYNDAVAKLNGSATTTCAPHASRLFSPIAPDFAQVARRPVLIRPHHTMTRTPGVRVAS